MSTPESNNVQTTIHSNGAIRKSLLTPYRRIGLSRNKQTHKNNSFISPLQNKVLIPVDNVSLSPVNSNSKEATREEICITTTVQNNCKRINNVNNQRNENVSDRKDEFQLSDIIKESSEKVKKYQARNAFSKNKEDNSKECKEKYNAIKDNSINVVVAKKNNTKVSNIRRKCSLQESHNTEIIDEKLQNISFKNEADQSVKNIQMYENNTEMLNYINTDHNYYVSNTKEKSSNQIQIENYSVHEVIDTKLREDISNTNPSISPIVIIDRLTDEEFKKKSKEVNGKKNGNSVIETVTSKDKLHKNEKKRLFDDNNSAEETFQGFSNIRNLEVNKVDRRLNEPKLETPKRKKISNLQNNNEKDIIHNHNINLDQNQIEVIENENIGVNPKQGTDDIPKTFETESFKKNLQDDVSIPSNDDPTNRIKLAEKSNRSMRRKLSLKKSISSSNLSQSSETSNTLNELERDEEIAQKDTSVIIDKIIELEKIVENKDDELQRLQQAQIYRTIHKIDNLKVDMQIWKEGCQEALRDLLIKLNEHNTIDMKCLLSQLKAPSHLFTYDSENDCFM